MNIGCNVMTKNNMLNSRERSGSAIVIIIEHLKWRYNLLRDRICARFSTRPMIAFIKNNIPNGNGFVGIEIGVYHGYHSRNILRNLLIKKLFLIDPYGTYIQDGDAVFENAKKDLLKYQDKIEFVRKTSDDAINDVPNELDFIYIDGNHEYEYVKNDFIMYYPKVKQGGIIGGHDFDTCLGVREAVTELCREMDLKLHNHKNDWWTIKK